jgi:Pilus assembly protein, PilO
MTKKKKTSQNVWIAAVSGGLLLVALLGYFLVVSPQRSKAADLQKQIVSTQKQVDAAHALVAKAKNAQKVKVADLFKLTKAMPDNPDEAGVLLDLQNVARLSGIDFASISVLPSTALSSYQVIPLQVEFDGNFYSLSDFLFRLRNLVDVRRGALDATGRLFAVDNVALDEGAHLFPQIRAQIKIDAFVYGTGSPSAVAPTQSSAAAPGATGTAPAATTTSPTTTTTPAPAGTAAGSTTGGTQ